MVENADNKKICFIVCVSDAQYWKECKSYIERLIIPKGYILEILKIESAQSMASAYNQGMRSSDAKYKIYIHQDLFILHQEFLSDILNIFEDETIGMLGIVGGTELPNNGIIYTSWNCGRLYTDDSNVAFEVMGKMGADEKAIDVMAIDGCLMSTQYDIPWREDLFDGWDFYDVSQSLEFIKKGYRVVVCEQKESWCFHDDGCQMLKDYDRNRKIFMDNYISFLTGKVLDNKIDFNEELYQLTQRTKQILIQISEQENYSGVHEYLSINYLKLGSDTELSILKSIIEIVVEEMENKSKVVFYSPGKMYTDVKEKYIYLKFLLRRLEFQIEDYQKEIYDEIICKRISPYAFVKMIIYHVIHKKEVIFELALGYEKAGNSETARILRSMIIEQ